jgi:hypothetical protein
MGDRGRHPVNKAAVADVRFGAHYGLNSDIELGPKPSTLGDIPMLFNRLFSLRQGGEVRLTRFLT